MPTPPAGVRTAQTGTSPYGATARPQNSQNRSPVRLALLVPAQEVGRPRRPVHPETARRRVERRLRQQPDHGVRALLGRAQDRPREHPEARQARPHPGGVGPARVHDVDADAAAGELLGPPLGEHHLHPLRPCVRRDAGELALAVLRVVDRQRLRVHAPGGHEHDASAGRQRGSQQRRQQVRTEHVHAQGQLVALARLGPLLGHQPGVVDEAVERRHPRREVAAKRCDARQGPEVALLHDDLGVRHPPAYAARRRLAALPVAARAGARSRPAGRTPPRSPGRARRCRR